MAVKKNTRTVSERQRLSRCLLEGTLGKCLLEVQCFSVPVAIQALDLNSQRIGTSTT